MRHRIGAVLARERLATRVRLADEDAPLEAGDLPEMLQEQQAGRAGAGDEDGAHAARRIGRVQRVARHPGEASDGGMRMQDARERFGERCLLGRQGAAARHGVDGRQHEQVGQPALEPGDAVLGQLRP